MGRIGNIINRKGKQDAQRAKVFTKHARAIAVAAKDGGGDRIQCSFKNSYRKS